MQNLDGQNKGVAGWLLLLCLGLTVYRPLITLRSLSGDLETVLTYRNSLPGYAIVTAIVGILGLLLACFSLYAGISLWSIKPNAVKIAKGYLIASLIYTFVSIGLHFVAGLPSQMNTILIITSIVSAASSILLFIIWFLYLSKSKRVKATYG